MQDPARQFEELVRRTGQGDHAAFAALYRATAAKLFAIALRIIPQREIAEEVLQESFVAVWEQAAEYDPMRGTVMGWLGTIVRHGAIDRLRRQTSRPEGRRAPEALLLNVAAADDTARGAELRALQYCLDQIEERPRRAVLLAYLYGLTRDELATELKVPIGTVKSWVRRSLDRLKRCLDA